MMNYDSYPNRGNVAGIRNYIERRVPPGGFLLAILTNDLREACARANHINQRLIFEIVVWFWNEAPANCWGSHERVEEWLNGE